MLALVTHQNAAAHKASLRTGALQADRLYLLCATALPNVPLPISTPHQSLPHRARCQTAADNNGEERRGSKRATICEHKRKKSNLQEGLDGGCGWSCIPGSDSTLYHVTYSKALSKTQSYVAFPPLDPKALWKYQCIYLYNTQA